MMCSSRHPQLPKAARSACGCAVAWQSACEMLVGNLQNSLNYVGKAFCGSLIGFVLIV